MTQTSGMPMTWWPRRSSELHRDLLRWEACTCELDTCTLQHCMEHMEHMFESTCRPPNAINPSGPFAICSMCCRIVDIDINILSNSTSEDEMCIFVVFTCDWCYAHVHVPPFHWTGITSENVETLRNPVLTAIFSSSVESKACRLARWHAHWQHVPLTFG